MQALGGVAVAAGGTLDAAALTSLGGFSAVIWWGDALIAQSYSLALATRPGPILPLITDCPDAAHVLVERHLCIDTTASGGNAELLAEMGTA